MLRFALRRLGPALLLFVVAGCTGSVVDGTGTSEGASTVAPGASAPAQATIAGYYDGHGSNEWDGSLEIKNASAETFDFDFEISPDLDIAPVGRLGGTAKIQDNGHYVYKDDECTIDFERVADATASRRGDLFVNADIACALDLGIDGHDTSSTALDFTATWHRN